MIYHSYIIACFRLHSFFRFYFSATHVDAHAHKSRIQREHLNLGGHLSRELYGENSMKVMVGNRKVEMSHEQFKLLMMTVSTPYTFHHNISLIKAVK